MARVSVEGIRTFVEGSKSGTGHLEVDLHKRSYGVALLQADGAWKEWTMPSSPTEMAIRQTELYRLSTWYQQARIRKGRVFAPALRSHYLSCCYFLNILLP